MKRCLAALLICLTFVFSSAFAQTTPVCESTAQDADGDGFGWVSAPRTATSLNEETYSCVVDETTASAPSIIHRETNAEVQLVRAYWDANRDLAGRALECTEHRWNDAVNLYEMTAVYDRLHDPLPAAKPWINTWTETRYQPNPITRAGDKKVTQLLWTVVDGVLNDQVSISSLQSQREVNNLSWVEIIDIHGGIQNGTRWWWNNSSSQYYQCVDPTTNLFVPTGTPNTPATQADVFSNQSVIFSSVVETEKPEIDREEEIILSNGAMWDIQDLAFKSISCNAYFETYGDDPQNTWWKFEDNSAYTMMFLPGAISSPKQGYIAYQYLHTGRNSAVAVPWVVMDDGTIRSEERSFPVGTPDWFELASDENARDVLIYWRSPESLTVCRLNRSRYDTPYTFADLTQAEHKKFLIKINIDTSHCTTPENTRDHLFGAGIKSCIAADSNSEDTPPTDTTNSDSNQTPIENNNTEGQSNASGDESTNTNTSVQNSTGDTGDTGGGIFNGIFLWLLVMCMKRKLHLRVSRLQCK